MPENIAKSSCAFIIVIIAFISICLTMCAVLCDVAYAGLASDTSSAGGDDSVSYNGNSYKYFNPGEVTSWQEAESYCESLGGHLATITSEAENDFIFSYLQSIGVSNAYFGFSDSASEGVWRWVTGETSSYTNWHDGEPNDSGGEDYAMYYWKYSDGTWNDGNYGCGTVSDDMAFICEWEGQRQSLEMASVSGVSTLHYTGKKLTPKPVVRMDGNVLKEGADYKLSFSNNLNPGTARIVITGKNGFVGSKSIVFTISKASASSFTASTASKFKYTGKLIKPKPHVLFNGKRLTLNKDYVLLYSNNKKCGKATITIKGKGKFSGTKKVTFQILKPKTLTLSKNRVTLNLVNNRSTKLKATKNYLSGTVKWKSSNKGIVAVSKEGKLTAKAKGSATVTAYVGKVKKTCKVMVKDVAIETITYGSFKDFDKWNKAVQLAERNLIGLSGNVVTRADGKTYYTGNIIAGRTVLEYKTVDVRANDITGPVRDGGYANKMVHLKLPSKVRYKLHRHNLSSKVNSKNVGRVMAGLVEQKLVWTQECSCGLECILSWDIPLPDDNENFDGDTTIQANSVMTVQRPAH